MSGRFTSRAESCSMEAAKPTCNAIRNLALVFCAMLILSGCSDRKKKDAATEPKNAPAPIATVRLGVILPETGDLAKYGKTAHAAVQLAVDEINSDPQASLRFQCVYEDDGLIAGKGVLAARKLITVDKVPILIGPLASTITLAVAPLAQNAGVVLLSPGSSSPGITDAGPFIFRNCLSDEYEGSAMASFARDHLGLKRVAVYYINNDFGVGLSKVFQEDFKKAGEIVLTESFPQGARDHRAAITKLKAAKPQAVYLVGYDEMISVFRQAKELAFTTQWLGTTFLNDQSLVDKTGNDADNTVLSAWVFDPKSPNPRVKAFAESIRKRTGGLEPDVYCANSYDAVYLIAEAVRLRGVTSDQVREGLLAIKEFDGVTGKTTFTKKREVMKKIEFKRIFNGRLTPFAPTK